VLRAEGSIVHPGSRVATAQAKLLDGDGTLFAHASSSWLIQAAARKEKKEPIAA
jgi:acyl-coenzyme A thioesterase PaaI-like protein